MALREFTDESGNPWTVWEVAPRPGSDRVRSVPELLRHGWLAFQCGPERRRLAPVPEGWEKLSRDQLIALLSNAEKVSGRPTA